MNQIIIANFMVQVGKFANMDIDENLFRHMVVNSIRAMHRKYASTYGEMVLAFDGPESWRKEVFPYYKASRKSGRAKSDINWTQIFKLIDVMRQELTEFFPYPVIWLKGCEADDIIGTLVRHKEGERILILSADKDFIQLQNQLFVEQYDPINNRQLTTPDPERYLKEHIIRGDTGDGIPNTLTQGDIFLIQGKRSKSITVAILEDIINRGKDALDETQKLYYDRNEKLINLEHTPAELKQNIIEAYEAGRGKNRSKLLDYFINKGMKNLIELVNDF